MKHLHPKWDELLPNQKKTLRQKEILGKFISSGGRGYFLGVTGFGKTRLGLMAIRNCFVRDSNRVVHVIVPSTPLKEQWEGLCKEWPTVKVYVIISYLQLSKEEQVCDFLVADEIHRYTNELSDTFSTLLDVTEYKFVLGLSATLDQEKCDFLNKRQIPFIDEVTMEEAKRENYVANFEIYAIGIPFSESDEIKLERLTKEFNRIFMHFNFDLQFMFFLMSKAGKNALQEFAEEKGWDTGEAVGLARRGITLMNERKTMLQKAESKIDATKEVASILSGEKIITFSQFNETVDKLTKAIPGSKGYHSDLKTIYFEDEVQIDITPEEYKELKAAGRKIKKKGKTTLQKEIKAGYINNEFSVLHSTKALDEGLDVPDITAGIVTSYSSKPLQLVQRIGRAVRFVIGKRSIIVVFYSDSATSRSQEEKWLREAAKQLEMIWCDMDEFKQYMKDEKSKTVITDK